jgi:hypothetical protein
MSSGRNASTTQLGDVHHLADVQIHRDATQSVGRLAQEAVVFSEVMHRRPHRLFGRLQQVGGPSPMKNPATAATTAVRASGSALRAGRRSAMP